MTVLQIAVNIILSVVFITLAHVLFGYVSGVPGVVVFLVDVLLVIGTFASNVAGRVGVK